MKVDKNWLRVYFCTVLRLLFLHDTLQYIYYTFYYRSKASN